MKFVTPKHAFSRRRARPSLRLCLIAVAACGLTACKHNEHRGEVAGWTLIDASQRHPILVTQEPETLSIRVARGTHGLNPHQRAELLDFAQRARAGDAGNSKLIVSVPTGGTNEVSTMYAVQDIRQLLTGIGFPQSSVAVDASYDESGPIRVSYLRYVAEPPTCGDWSTNLARDPQNLPYPNLGCATQRNFAVMVANPADLLGPRTETERAPERRRVTYDKYVKGEVTAAAKGDDEQIKTTDD